MGAVQCGAKGNNTVTSIGPGTGRRPSQFTETQWNENTSHTENLNDKIENDIW